VCFLWHFPWARARRVLPGTLLYGARTFLAGLDSRAVTWLTPRAILPGEPASPIYTERLDPALHHVEGAQDD